MRKSLLWGSLLLCWVGMASAQSSPNRHVFSSEELTRSGIVRLSDIFRLLNDWEASFVDAYTWRAAPHTLSSPGAASWRLLVNGQPLSTTALGAFNLNTIPVHPAQLDSVVVWSTPTTVSGLPAPGGLIHLHTRSPEAGPAAQFSLSMGNEIGDAGPYMHTSLNSVNVDRIGPNLLAEGTYGTQSGFARLSVKGDVHHATDARIRKRILRHYDYDTIGEPPRRILYAPRLEARWQEHVATVHYTRFYDLRRLEPLGSELPTIQQRLHGGLSGILSAWRYRLSATRQRFTERRNRDQLRFGWHQDHLSGNAAYQRPHFALGGSFDYKHSRANSTLHDPSVLTTRLYARLHPQRIPLRPQARLFLTSTDGVPGGLAQVRFTARPAAPHRIALSLTAHRQAYAAKNTLYYWITQGYTFPERRGADLALPSTFTTPGLLAVDLHWNNDVTSRMAISVKGGFRQFWGHNLSFQEIGYDAENGLRPHTNVRPGVNGRLWHTGVSVRWELLPALRQRLHANYLFPTSGDDTFERAWRSAPRFRFDLNTQLSPDPRFHLSGRLAYRPSTRWPSFRNASRQSSGLYPNRLPPVWQLDVTATKQLGGDHLRAQIQLRNLLNEKIRRHPTGAISRLMLFVSLQMRL